MPIDPKITAYRDAFLVKEGKEVNLKKFDTDYDHQDLPKEEGERLLEAGIQEMAQLQDKLYAHNQYSVLLIFQAMDAAGKDGIVKHVMSGLNPQGVRVTSFKVPTALELKHDFLWRHSLALPAKGEIGIFNRSHYENVLVTRVHPELILNEGLPGINKPDNIDQAFWDSRFREINNFEKTLVENGTVILKFFLHISKKEQKRRFLERIDNPAKNWKFSTGDITERGYWKAYRKAYENMLENTSKQTAPWFVVPADDKWFSRLVVAGIIVQEFEKLNLSYPVVSDAQKQELEKAKQLLLSEKTKDNGNDDSNDE
ncbi:MAG TPA: polyphosphate kinase 2 family protein [Puia sp.]|nr:polyphosphate kinase 2 family protein [Puia sp.]